MMLMRRAATANANAVLSVTVLVALVLAASLARADELDSISDPSVVSTTAGKVQGEVVDGIYTFKGIPYAADTGGANRWAAPKDPEPWSDVRNATTFMDVCPQAPPGDFEKDFNEAFPKGDEIAAAVQMLIPLPGTPMSEDCLGLNVYTPALDENLPVMVWIHGGNLAEGAGSSYPGEVLANAGNVIVVTINYRLGFLGYIAHPDLNGTNFGLLDQVKALEWVRENIASFGGDPSNVTIFGESSGGVSVQALMASPLSEGLFQRVISQSANIKQSPNVTVSEGGKLGVAVGEELGFPAGAGQLEKMRAVSFEKLRDLGEKMNSPEYDFQLMNLYVDDTSLPSCIFCAFKEGSTHQVDLMIGTNNNESSVLLGGAALVDPSAILPVNSTSSYEQEVENMFGENAKEVLSLFPGSPDADAWPSYNLVFTAGTFGAPALFAANKSSDLGNPTFLYNFRGTANNPMLDPLEGFHGLELAYIWGLGVPDTELGKTMQKYWTTFARTGNPNAESLPEWKAFEGVSPSWMVLSDDKIASEPVPEDMQTLYAIMNEFYPNYTIDTNGGQNYFTAQSTSNE